MSKYARNQASGVILYSLEKGGYFFFKKKVGGSFAVTCVTKSIKSIKSILLEHFKVLQSCYKLLQNTIMLVKSTLLGVTYPTRDDFFSILKKYTYPFFCTIENYD